MVIYELLLWNIKLSHKHILVFYLENCTTFAPTYCPFAVLLEIPSWIIS